MKFTIANAAASPERMAPSNQPAAVSAKSEVAKAMRPSLLQFSGSPIQAASAGKALVTSDTRVLRDYFGSAAVHTAPEPAAIAAAVREALGRRGELEAVMRDLRDRRLAAQDDGLHRLAAVLAE